jgi:hypothetical protein
MNQFKIEDNKVYYQSYLLKRADPETFEALNENYGKDQEQVFYLAQELETADPKSAAPLTFKGIQQKYFSNDYSSEKDPKAFFQSLERTTKANVERFLKDDQHIYYVGRKLPNVDARSAELIGFLQNITYFLIRDKKTVYLYDEGTERITSLSDDPDSFKVLSPIYFKDSKQVLTYKGKSITEADAESFEVLKEESTSADLGRGRWAKDNKAVYVDGQKLPKVNPKTFQLLSSCYGKDDKFAYCWATPLPKVDLKTFERLSGITAKDKNYVYVRESVLEYANPQSFQVLTYGYGKDAERVFFLFYHPTLVVAEADPETFFVTESGMGVDKNHVFIKAG